MVCCTDSSSPLLLQYTQSRIKQILEHKSLPLPSHPGGEKSPFVSSSKWSSKVLSGYSNTDWSSDDGSDLSTWGESLVFF